MLSLSVAKREILGKTNKRLPKTEVAAVLYGRTVKSTPLSVSKIDFHKVWKEVGESSVISLTDESGVATPALIHEVSFDPIKDEPMHVDFYAVEKDKKVRVQVPIEFEGISPAVKDLGGVLLKVLHEIEVEALPQDLPQEIVINISSLTQIDAQVLISDVKTAPGIKIMNDADEVVVAIAPPTEEKEETGPTDISQIEVEKKGKKEEEGATPTE